MNVRSILKYTLITISSLIALIIIAVVILVTVVNPNHYKPLIIKSVAQATGRTLSLPGDISWKIFPNLGLHIGQASLSNPAQFTNPDFIKINSFDISLKLLPLFRGAVVIDTLKLNGLNLALIKQNGQNNWTFNVESNQQVAIAENNKSDTDEKKPITLQLSGLALESATLTYDDLDTKKQQGINNLTFILSTDKGGKIAFDSGKQTITLNKVNFNLDNMVNGKLNFVLHNFANPNYNGDINLPPFSINQVLDRFNIANKARANKTLLNQFTAQTIVKGDMNNLTLSNLSVGFPNIMQVNAKQITVESLPNPSYAGDINVPTFSLNKVLDGLNIANRIRASMPLLNQVNLQTNFSGNINNISLNNLKVAVPNNVQAQANVTVNNFKTPQFSGNLKVPTFSLNKVLDGLNIAKPARANKTLFNQFNTQTNFSGTTDSINLSDLKFAFPNNFQGTGNLKLQNFKNLQYSGNINIPTFSLNNVMVGLGFPKPDLPNKTVLNQVALQSDLAGTTNSLNLTRLLANLSATTLSGTVNISSFSPLKLTEDVNLNQMELSDFVNAMGYKMSLKNLKANGSVALTNSNSFIAGLNAKQNINVGNATLLGFSVNNFISQIDKTLTDAANIVNGNSIKQITHGDANAILKGISQSGQVVNAINNMKHVAAQASSPGAKTYSQQTDFGNLEANVQVKNGVVSPSSYKLSGPSIRSSGSGNVNLNNETLNYKASTQLVTPQKNEIINYLVFPLQVSGPIDDPKGGLDWGSIQQQLVKYIVDKNKKQIQDEVKNTVTNTVKNQVGKAVNNAKQNLINNIFGR